MTIRDLAKIAGVSPATVSIALNGKSGISESTRKKIADIAEQYQYYLTPRKKSVKSHAVLLIKIKYSGLFVNSNYDVITNLLNSIEERCRFYGLHLDTIQVERTDLSSLASSSYHDYSGAIILGTELLPSDFSFLDHFPIPFVVVDNPMRYFKSNTVSVNHYENAHRALQYLKENGHTRLGYLKSQQVTENVREREEAFYAIAAKMGMHVCPDNCFSLEPSFLGSAHMLNQYLEKRTLQVTCMVADNDMISIGATKALIGHGYQVPQDISVLGYDDILYSAVNSPTLSSVHVQKALIGYTTVDLLALSIQEPNLRNTKIQITGRVYARESVRCL